MYRIAGMNVIQAAKKNINEKILESDTHSNLHLCNKTYLTATI